MIFGVLFILQCFMSGVSSVCVGFLRCILKCRAGCLDASLVVYARCNLTNRFLEDERV